MLKMNDYQMHVLFDSDGTHSFIANKNVAKLSKETKRVEKGFIIGTPLGETVETDVVFEGVGININGCELEADLIPLELSDFDKILGMNWLGKNKARLDCFTKTVTFQGLRVKQWSLRWGDCDIQHRKRASRARALLVVLVANMLYAFWGVRLRSGLVSPRTIP
jgi:hypothetical protein